MATLASSSTLTAGQTLDGRLAHFEKSLNKVGYFPLASTISGILRITYGKLEVICALAIAVFKFMASLGHTDINQRRALEIEAAYALQYVEHGIANILRGLVEIVPLVNLTCIAYDHFAARFAYPSEGNVV